MIESRHFDITEWADYVRNLVSAEQHERMSVHLQSGCSKCEKIEGLLSRFAAICTREAAYEVPRFVEQQVKALVGLAKAPRRRHCGIYGPTWFMTAQMIPSLQECGEHTRSTGKFCSLLATTPLICALSMKRALPAWCWLAKLPTRRRRMKRWPIYR